MKRSYTNDKPSKQAAFYSIADRTVLSIPADTLPTPVAKDHLTVIMLDKSGSMGNGLNFEDRGVSRMEHAKRLILERADHLDYNNLILITFNTYAHAEKISSYPELRAFLDSITPGGGTNFTEACHSLGRVISSDSNRNSDVTIWNVTDMGFNVDVQRMERVLGDATKGNDCYIEYFYTQLAQEGRPEDTEKIHMSLDKALNLDGKTSSVPIHDNHMIHKLEKSLNTSASYNFTMTILPKKGASSMKVIEKTAVTRDEDNRMPAQVKKVLTEEAEEQDTSVLEVRARCKKLNGEVIDIFLHGTLDEGSVIKCLLNGEFHRYKLTKDNSLIHQHKLALHSRLMHITGNTIDVYSRDESSAGNLEKHYIQMLSKFCSIIMKLESPESYCARALNATVESLSTLYESNKGNDGFLESVFLQLFRGNSLKELLEGAFFPSNGSDGASIDYIKGSITSIKPDLSKLHEDRQKLKSSNLESKINGTQFAISSVAKMQTRGPSNDSDDDEAEELIAEIERMFKNRIDDSFGINTEKKGIIFIKEVIRILEPPSSDHHVELRKILLEDLGSEFGCNLTSLVDLKEIFEMFGVDLDAFDTSQNIKMLNTINKILEQHGISELIGLRDINFVEVLKGIEYTKALDVLNVVKVTLHQEYSKLFTINEIDKQLRVLNKMPSHEVQKIINEMLDNHTSEPEQKMITSRDEAVTAVTGDDILSGGDGADTMDGGVGMELSGETPHAVDMSF